MEQWAIKTLKTDDKGNILLETFADGGVITCNPSIFADMTSAITSLPPTYAALSALPIASAGWQQYFDAWKAAGYIS